MDMQPQQTPNPGGNYDFIMNPNQAPKRPLLPGGNSMAQRAVMVAIGAVVLMIIIIIVSSLLNSGPDNKLSLIKATQQQTEMVRVSDLTNTSGSQTTRNIALNTSLTLASDSQKLQAALAERGIKIKQKQLLAGKNPDTDKKLDQAKAASAYDTTFLQIMDDSLGDYQATLQDAFTNSHSPTLKQLLSQEFTNAKLLRNQIDQAAKQQ